VSASYAADDPRLQLSLIAAWLLRLVEMKGGCGASRDPPAQMRWAAGNGGWERATRRRAGRGLPGLVVPAILLLAVAPRLADLSPLGASVDSRGGGLGIVVEALPGSQQSAGGFGKPPSLQATSRALMLAKLYGLLGRIDCKKAGEFLQGATGWGSEPRDQGAALPAAGERKGVGSVADVYTLHEALLSYQHLGLPLPELDGAPDFLLSLWDDAAALFAGFPGGAGGLRASVTALQVAELLGKRRSEQLEPLAARIRAEASPPPRNARRPPPPARRAARRAAPQPRASAAGSGWDLRRGRRWRGRGRDGGRRAERDGRAGE
jgi:hypothetical protein